MELTQQLDARRAREAELQEKFADAARKERAACASPMRAGCTTYRTSSSVSDIVVVELLLALVRHSWAGSFQTPARGARSMRLRLAPPSTFLISVREQNSTVMAVAAGYDHSGVLLEDGQGWSWGMNEMSQLGRERWGRYTECPPDKGTPQGGRAPSLDMGTEQPMAAADRRLTELHPMQAEASPSRLLRPFEKSRGCLLLLRRLDLDDAAFGRVLI